MVVRIGDINLRKKSCPENSEAESMAKYDGIIGQDILTVTEGDNELTIILRDNRYLFVRVINGKLTTESVPE